MQYKLRDWLFSRQRYWGEPFPIVWADGAPVAIPEQQLPVRLPETEQFKPSRTGEKPEGPLAQLTDWVATTAPGSGRPARRETNTMPQWAGSCWYYLRFIDAWNSGKGWAAAKEWYWMPVDLYVGGSEHAVLHLLYAGSGTRSSTTWASFPRRSPSGSSSTRGSHAWLDQRRLLG